MEHEQLLKRLEEFEEVRNLLKEVLAVHGVGGYGVGKNALVERYLPYHNQLVHYIESTALEKLNRKIESYLRKT